MTQAEAEARELEPARRGGAVRAPARDRRRPRARSPGACSARSARRRRRCGSSTTRSRAASTRASAAALWLTARAAGTAARRRVGDVPLSETPRGAMVIAALNGLYGDRLEAEGSALAIPMQRPPARRAARRTSRSSSTGSARPSTRGARRATASGWRGPRHHAGLRPLQHRPPHLRRTARRWRRCSTSWSRLAVEVERIALVGHSMGGLVARSACHRGGDWTRARAPHRLARHAARGRAARAGRARA